MGRSILEIAEDKTIKISFGVLATVSASFAALIFGAAVWMTTIEVRAQVDRENLNDFKQEIVRRLDEMNVNLKALPEMDRRLIGIEVLLDATNPRPRRGK